MGSSAHNPSALDSLVRHYWSWISESFLHVSALEEWGEKALSERISKQYESEIPRAFRLIELMLESKTPIALGYGHEDRQYGLPDPARSVREMAGRELAVMQGFAPQLAAMNQKHVGIPLAELSRILDEATASREQYMAWLMEQKDGLTEQAGRLCRTSNEPGWLPLNRLLLQLIDAIDETSIHMLVLRHVGRADEAEWSWQRSYEYMLLAYKIARYLASREWAIDFHAEAVVGDRAGPRIGVTASQAQDVNRAREVALKGFVSRFTEAGSSEDGAFEEASSSGSLLSEIASRIVSLSDDGPVSGPSMRAVMERYIESC